MTRMRVRAYCVIIGIFTFRNLGFWFVFSYGVFPHQNVHRKQHVVLVKTTRRFKENKHSFYRKQHVVLKKTSTRFIGNNTSFL